MGRVVRGSVVSLLVCAVLGAATPACRASEVPDERAQVAAVARDYMESWYNADPDRMGRALHPDMVKRYVDSFPTGRQVVHSVTRDLMIEMTRGGGGSKLPPEDRKIAVNVFEVSGDIAAARVSSSEYMEYLSLAKCNGRWTILNILWRLQASGARPH